jgi:lipoate-protein ligase A
MALDEVLLQQLKKPLLRLYKWKAPCITFGYFQKYAEVKGSFPKQLLVRRSSGGGCVEHGRDLTFSLMIPSSNPLGAIPPLLFYQQLHEAVVRALREFKITSHLAKPEETLESTCCFEAPALYDLLMEGKKILGGAQRRSLGALLYQGSLLLPRCEESLKITREDQNAKHFFQNLAAHLAMHVTMIEEDPLWLKEATALAARRYRSDAWTYKR